MYAAEHKIVYILDMSSTSKKYKFVKLDFSRKHLKCFSSREWIYVYVLYNILSTIKRRNCKINIINVSKSGDHMWYIICAYVKIWSIFYRKIVSVRKHLYIYKQFQNFN